MTTTGNLKFICLEINIVSINRWNNKKNIKEHQEKNEEHYYIKYLEKRIYG